MRYSIEPRDISLISLVKNLLIVVKHLQQMQ